jgi:hypothetical protein
MREPLLQRKASRIQARHDLFIPVTKRELHGNAFTEQSMAGTSSAKVLFIFEMPPHTPLLVKTLAPFKRVQMAFWVWICTWHSL